MNFRKLIKSVTATLLAPLLFLVSASMPAGASPKVTVLAFGLFGAQSVFESEAKGAASIVAQRLGADLVVVRANTKTREDVTITSIRNISQSTAERMDRQSDILFLILTSHGSQDGVAVEAGRRSEILSPGDLADILKRAGVRHCIVVISACYSGVFIRPLANDDTLVITAADSNHSSFGCQDKVKWTYFGDAFFNTALRHTADLRQAFDEARAIVRQRERRYHLVPSNPQIAGGKNIDVLLGKTGGAEALGRQP
jgi:Peptidase C13 family